MTPLNLIFQIKCFAIRNRTPLFRTEFRKRCLNSRRRWPRSMLKLDVRTMGYDKIRERMVLEDSSPNIWEIILCVRTMKEGYYIRRCFWCPRVRAMSGHANRLWPKTWQLDLHSAVHLQNLSRRSRWTACPCPWPSAAARAPASLPWSRGRPLLL